MTYKTILVHIDTTPQAGARLELALSIAQSCGAHLIGLYLPELAQLPGFVGVEIPPSLLDQLNREKLRHRNEAANTLDRAVRGSGLTSYEWRGPAGSPIDTALNEARYADLVIIGQRNPDEPNPLLPDGFEESLLIGNGGPVLMTPYTGKDVKIAENVLVAWNCTREAARAVKDALPLLTRARKVTVMTIGPRPADGESPDASAADVARFLSRHGIHAETVFDANVAIDAGEWLLSRASDLGAQLIVMGAYGHTRLRELILGGVTRTLLKEMTVPVLMSH
jgi:nucleotide-binding universal stress UspA family protein